MTSNKTCDERLINSMNTKLSIFQLFLTLSSVFLSGPTPIYTKSIATKAKPNTPAIQSTAPTTVKTANKPTTPITQTPQAPYIQELKALKSIPTEIVTAWNSLYAKYLQVSSNSNPVSTLTPTEINSLKPLFETNLFTLMQNQCQPTTFPKLLNDPQGTIHTTYAVTHLAETCARLASICSIKTINNKPTVHFTGDNRDMGIIVNIQNNSNAEFSINQTAKNGSNATQIGLISHGLNEVNLHTAALQEPTNTPTTTPTSSTQVFELQELNAQNPTTIKLAMMSGSELITFLESLPRKDKKVVEMNGLPTSPEFLAESADWYFVLIQNPTPSTATNRNPDQRIQAINVSKLSGPYLLTIQINPFTIDLPATDTASATTMDIFQPSINTLLTPKNKFADLSKCPSIILPQFLWNLPELQPLWMLQTTTYLATLTDFKLFGLHSFGNAYEYFSNLGFFENKNNYALFIDLYNRVSPDYVLYNASWLRATALYETNLKWCSDVPQIYTSQDAYGHILVNESNFYYINFLAILKPNAIDFNSELLFKEQGFNASFASPFNQLYSFIINALLSDIKEGIFGSITQISDQTYRLTWTNKKNQILGSQTLYLNNPLSNIEITFVNQTTNWIGSAVPTPLIQLEIGQTSHFKVTYEYSPANNKHILLAQSTSPIDKQEVFLPLQFSEYPIKNLYIDAFETFNVQPYTRCFIIKDGDLPEVFAGLTDQDWQSGIYVVPKINKNLKNETNFKVLFYKSNKTYIGTMNYNLQFIANAYNIHFSQFNGLMDLYPSTGVFLTYNKPD